MPNNDELSIDSILDKLLVDSQFTSDPSKIVVPRAKQALFQLLLEVIGEDEPEPMVKDGNYGDPINIARNLLRDRQRTKLKQLFNIKENK